MIDNLKTIHKELNIGPTHLSKNRLLLCEQPPLVKLEVVDIDFEGKPFILERAAANAWRRMSQAAEAEGVLLRPFSGFRSYLHQRNIIKRKLEKGRDIDAILTETAIPGFSEHHSGKAIDICTDNKFELEESFEKTAAFDWLVRNANRFYFRLSYPRNNNLGIIYEPWHWCFLEK